LKLEYKLSNRVNNIKPSPTLAVTARAAQLRQAGKDIISLGAGEPDFDTPEHVKEAAIKAIHAGQTKYTAVDGTPELKQAIIDKFKRDNNLSYDDKQILVSSGGKQSFFNLCQAILEKDDEVIIPAPYWVSYPDIVLLADAKPIIIQCPDNKQFKLTPDQLEQALNSNTKLFVLNSPSNPTGKSYSANELLALSKVLLKYPQVLIATDDMYEHILWTDSPFANIVNVCPELLPRTLVLNGVSKAYSMTGWRIGYAAGPKKIIKAMKKVQSQSTSNPCSISQAAAYAALNGDQTCVQTMLKSFHERHDYLVAALNSIDGIHCLPSDGTFYSFPNMQQIIKKRPELKNDLDLAEFFIEKAGVAMVPGSAFGAEGYMRLSFATDIDILKRAVEKITLSLK